MNSSVKKGILSLLFFFFIFGVQKSFAQDGPKRPWTKNQVIQPAQLAAEINADSAGDILILNTGPVDDIKGAVNIGPVEYKKNVRKLKKYLRHIPKDQAIVFYCGCCSMETCPNIMPAFDLLKKEGFTNFRILNIEENLSEDWISKDYPMANHPSKK
ncbi:MAG TPA: rhodanese-like domain-containing protein [Edaphocola sp.]|nr:rhodanese-like domain-containing protein [Edaphocola sp.]